MLYYVCCLSVFLCHRRILVCFYINFIDLLFIFCSVISEEATESKHSPVLGLQCYTTFACYTIFISGVIRSPFQFCLQNYKKILTYANILSFFIIFHIYLRCSNGKFGVNIANAHQTITKRSSNTHQTIEAYLIIINAKISKKITFICRY